MKRLFLSAIATAFLFSSGAVAQNLDLDLRGNADQIANTAAIYQTRWMPVIRIVDVATAATQYVTIPMDAILLEAWVVISSETNHTFRITLNKSPYLGAFTTEAIAIIPFDDLRERTVGGRVNTRLLVRFNRGDSIVISTDGAATGTSVGHITLRFAN